LDQKLAGARVLVTGATGFIGQYAAAALSNAGAEVVPVSKSAGYDLRNEAEAMQATFLARPHIVVHLAASREGKGRPATVFKDDVQMGLNVIHAAALTRSKVVFLASDRIYDDHDCTPQKTLLSALKSYRAQYGMPCAMLVAQNAYGPGDALVSELSKVFLKADPSGVVTLSAGAGPFHLTHAMDVALAIASAAAGFDGDTAVDLPGAAITFDHLAKLVAESSGFKGRLAWNGTPKEQTNGAATFGAEAGALLKWSPTIPIEEGVRQTVEWVRGASGAKA
jgi:UDP-glucose 4-epimerase